MNQARSPNAAIHVFDRVRTDEAVRRAMAGSGSTVSHLQTLTEQPGAT
jgi:hypothetical protein